MADPLFKRTGSTATHPLANKSNTEVGILHLGIRDHKIEIILAESPSRVSMSGWHDGLERAQEHIYAYHRAVPIISRLKIKKGRLAVLPKASPMLPDRASRVASRKGHRSCK
jgi:hypothetical protein